MLINGFNFNMLIKNLKIYKNYFAEHFKSIFNFKKPLNLYYITGFNSFLDIFSLLDMR